MFMETLSEKERKRKKNKHMTFVTYSFAGKKFFLSRKSVWDRRVSANDIRAIYSLWGELFTGKFANISTSRAAKLASSDLKSAKFRNAVRCHSVYEIASRLEICEHIAWFFVIDFLYTCIYKYIFQDVKRKYSYMKYLRNIYRTFFASTCLKNCY